MSATNLNNAYISKTDTNAQSINSTLTISGGALTLKNSVITDNANNSYLRIDPQGNNVIIYDGVNNQRLDVFSSSGSESTYITTLNGTKSIGQIDVSNSIDHLEIGTNSSKNIIFGSGNIGIGTSIPATRMHLFTNSDVYGLTVGDTVNGSNLKIAGTASGDMGYGLLQMFSGSTAGRDLVLQRDAGSVGIGTSSPSYKLDVNGAGNFTGSLNITGSGNALKFAYGGGGFNMIDTTWIRTYGSKSFYHDTGNFRTDGTLQVGNNGSTLSIPNNGTLSYSGGRFSVTTSGLTTINGSLTLNTAKNQGTGIKLDTVTIDTVLSTGNIGIGGLNQLRFGTSTSFDWNQWAGIKYDSSGNVLYIGGPASSQFSSNSTPPSINVAFTGVNNLGIGTDTPSYPLHVSKSSTGTALYVENTGSNDTLIELNSSGDSSHMIIQTNEISSTTGDLWIQNTGGHNLYINATGGNTGIGTTTPLQKLDVIGNLRVSGSVYGGTGTLNMLTDAGGALPVKVGSLSVTSSYSNNAPTNGLYVQGNVGIGTTSPLGKLQVTESGHQMYTGSDHLYLKMTSNNQYPYFGLVDSGGTRGMYLGAGTAGSYVTLGLENGNNLNINGGNVGIGTTSPAYPLDVVGNVQSSATYISNGNGDVFQALGTGTGVKTFRYDHSNLRFWTNSIEVMTLTSGGRIGINQANPSYQLDVSGDISTSTAFRTPSASNSQAYYVGNDSAIWDINVSNTIGIYGQSNTAVGGLKLGSTGPTLYGSGGTLGIGTTTPWTSMALDVNGSIKIASNHGIYSGYNNGYILNDHGNGNVTLNATNSTSGNIYLGYTNTAHVYLSTNLTTTSNTNIIDTSGKLYYQGNDTDTRYINSTGDTISGNLVFGGNANYGIYSDSANWTRIDPNGQRFIMPVPSARVTSGDLILSVEDTGNSWNKQFQLSADGSIIAKSISITGNVWMNNTPINSVSKITGYYGTIVDSYDEWLRFNDDGSHTSGIYFGSSVARTDGELQVGNGGASFRAQSSGAVTLSGDLTLSGTSPTIKASGSPAIQFKGGSSGTGMVIGAGGATILGAGESATTFWNGATASGSSLPITSDTEQLYLVSDNNIYFYGNMQPGFNVSGNISQYMAFENYGDTKLTVWNKNTTGNMNSSMEIRADGGGLSYLDFSTSSADYDARLLVDTNKVLNITAGDVQVNGHRVYRHYDNIKWGSGSPSGGQDGDIWIQI